MGEIFLPAQGSNASNECLLMVERGCGAFATGGTGEVYLAFTTSLKQPVAVKIIRLDGNTEKARNEFRSEMEAHSALGSSPFIIQYLGCYMYKHFAGVVMEYAVCGSLYDFLHHTYVKTGTEPAKVTFGTSLRNRIVYDIIQGIHFLHNIGSDQRAIHGDIKASNILLTGDLRAKLADFGCTKFQTVTQAQTSRGLPEGEVNSLTLRYTAPEVLERPRDKKRQSSDVYSYGIIVWEIWSREIPYAWCTTRDDIMRAILGTIKLSMPHEIKDEDIHLVGLFNGCLGSHCKRPTATDIMLNFPLQLSEVDAMQEAVTVRRHISDKEPTYPEQPEYLRNALNINDSPSSSALDIHCAQSQSTAIPGSSHHNQQQNDRRPVDRKVSTSHSAAGPFKPDKLLSGTAETKAPSEPKKPSQKLQEGITKAASKLPQQAPSELPQQRIFQTDHSSQDFTSVSKDLVRKPSQMKEKNILLVGDEGEEKQYLVTQLMNAVLTKHTGKHSRWKYQIGNVTHNVALSGFESCTPNKPVHLVLACFALNNLKSLENLPTWLNRVREKIGHAPHPVWIIALKEDLRQRFPERIIPDEMVQSVVDQFNPQKYMKCSDQCASDVDNVFDQAILYLHRIDDDMRTTPAKASSEPREPPQQPQSGTTRTASKTAQKTPSEPPHQTQSKPKPQGRKQSPEPRKQSPEKSSPVSSEGNRNVKSLVQHFEVPQSDNWTTPKQPTLGVSKGFGSNRKQQSESTQDHDITQSTSKHEQLLGSFDKEVSAQMLASVQTDLDPNSKIRTCHDLQPDDSDCSSQEICEKCSKVKGCVCNFSSFSMHYEELGRIVTGAPGAIVSFCKRKNDGKVFASKRMDTNFYKVAEKEIEILKNVENENIVGYHGCSDEPKFLSKIIVTQLCGGTVEQLVSEKKLKLDRNDKSCGKFKPIDQERGKFMDEKDFVTYFRIEVIDIVRQTVDGVQYLHDKGIVHRDIKPSNLLLYKKDNGKVSIKISDFGLSRNVGRNTSTKMTNAAGTPSFIAPEYCVDDSEPIKPTKRADIFSLGLCLYYICTTCRHPYGDDSDIHKYRIKNKNLPVMKDLLPGDIEKNDPRIELTNEQRVTAHHMLRTMLVSKSVKGCSEPEERPTIEEVKDHPALWNSERKVEMIEHIADVLKTHYGSLRKTEKETFPWVWKKLNWYNPDLLNDEQNNLDDAEKDDSRRLKYMIDHKKLPEVLQKRTDSCKELHEFYIYARNKNCHPQGQPREVQKVLGIVPGQENRDKMLDALFGEIPQHLINSYLFLEEHKRRPNMRHGNSGMHEFVWCKTHNMACQRFESLFKPNQENQLLRTSPKELSLTTITLESSSKTDKLPKLFVKP